MMFFRSRRPPIASDDMAGSTAAQSMSLVLHVIVVVWACGRGAAEGARAGWKVWSRKVSGGAAGSANFCWERLVSECGLGYWERAKAACSTGSAVR